MRLLIAAATLALAVAGASATAGEIYQWKDANGVTHYSESPPAKGEFQQRQVTSSGATAGSVNTPVAAAEPTENPQCATARANIQALEGEGPVQQEDDEGNLKVLDDSQREAQLELARAAVTAYCTGDAAE